jgi:hypothetical protein
VRPIAEAFAGARELSEWANWLATSPDESAKEILAFFDNALSHVAEPARKKIFRRLATSDSSNVDGLLYEILLFDVCRRMDLSPVFEPQAAGKTPDLRLQIGDQEYFADVFVTTRPAKTRIRFQGCDGWEDSGEAAKKIADVIDQKAAKYRNLRSPLLLFVARVGHDVSLLDLEIALFGSAVGEMKATGGLKRDCHKDWHTHGTFCPPGPEAKHRHVSAVISCDWFASVARTGQRLHCVIYHHWSPVVQLPISTFGCFPHVHFEEDARGHFIPAVSGVGNIVMSMTAEDIVRWAPYSPNQPW